MKERTFGLQDMVYIGGKVRKQGGSVIDFWRGGKKGSNVVV